MIETATNEQAWEVGAEFHTFPDFEPTVTIPLVAAVAYWHVEVDVLVSAETGKPGGTKTLLANGFHQIHITNIEGELQGAEVYRQLDEPSGATAYSENLPRSSGGF